MMKIFFLIISIIINKILSNDLDLDKAKLVSCISLSRSRMHHDKKIIEDLLKEIPAEEMKSIQNTLLTISLLNCNEKISIDQIKEIIQHKNPENINPLRPDYKLLLNLENWQEIYQSRSTEQLQEDVKSLHEKISNYFSKEGPENPSSTQKQKKNPKNPRENPVNYEKNDKKQGFNINEFINEMDENTKHAIQLGLWLLCAYIIFYVLRKLCSRKKIIKKVIKRVEKTENADNKNKDD